MKNTAIAVLLFCLGAPAQRRPAEVDTMVSPEVHADHRVTFRLRAPQASEVTVRGEWMPAQTREKLTKDESGVWSVTLGPLPPDIYSYSFTVDGVTAIDPRNPEVKLGVRSSNTSVLLLPGDSPALWDVRDVPHGAVHVNWYKSIVLGGATRRFYVYTPPDYDRNTSAWYPVLYLLHGSGDTEGEWTWFGHANLILDNLLAEGKIRPMIVVMPFGHATPPNDMSPASRGRNTSLFEEDLLKHVLPAAEAKYRVASGPRNRAIAGLSMGGGQSASVGLNHLDSFSWVGVFSAGAAADFETRFASVLADSEGTNKKLRLFWIGCGRDDPGFPRAERMAEIFEKHKIKHIFRKSEGAHTWRVWRRYLAEITPLLFRESS